MLFLRYEYSEKAFFLIPRSLTKGHIGRLTAEKSIISLSSARLFLKHSVAPLGYIWRLAY